LVSLAPPPSRSPFSSPAGKPTTSWAAGEHRCATLSTAGRRLADLAHDLYSGASKPFQPWAEPRWQTAASSTVVEGRMLAHQPKICFIFKKFGKYLNKMLAHRPEKMNSFNLLFSHYL
jgi:hypothetical protein